MDQAEGIARARAALDTAERRLGALVDRGPDPVAWAAVDRHLGELRRLLAQLEGGDEPPRRGDGADGVRRADAGRASRGGRPA